jgi:hypothetical protein
MFAIIYFHLETMLRYCTIYCVTDSHAEKVIERLMSDELVFLRKQQLFNLDQQQGYCSTDSDKYLLVCIVPKELCLIVSTLPRSTLSMWPRSHVKLCLEISTVGC